MNVSQQISQSVTLNIYHKLSLNFEENTRIIYIFTLKKCDSFNEQ